MSCVPHLLLKVVDMPDTQQVIQNRQGKQWISSQLKFILQHSPVQLTPYVSWRQSSEKWWQTGTTGSVLYFRLVGDTETQALGFPPTVIEACGAGDHSQRQWATNHIVGHLTAMGVLSAGM
jgi:hypothetical protein